MSIRSVFAFAIVLAAAACTDEPVPAGESTVDQETRLPPDCPAGDYLMEWEQLRDTCGGCPIGSTPGQIHDFYAGCSSDPLLTKRVMRTTCESC